MSIPSAYASKLETDEAGLYSIVIDGSEAIDVTLLNPFDPFPIANDDTTLQVADTLWVPVDENGPFYWNSIFKYREDLQALWVTSYQQTTLKAELSYISTAEESCDRRYNFDIHFEGYILNAHVPPEKAGFKSFTQSQSIHLSGPVESIKEIACFGLSGQRIPISYEVLKAGEAQVNFKNHLKGLHVLRFRTDGHSYHTIKINLP